MNSLIATEKRYSASHEGVIRLNDKPVGFIRVNDAHQLIFKAIDSFGMWDISSAKTNDDVIRRIDAALRLDIAKDVPFIFELPAYATVNHAALMIFQNEANAKILLMKADELLSAEQF